MQTAGNVRLEKVADQIFDTNSYLVYDPTTLDGAVIDANLEPQRMVDLIETTGVRVGAILLTHSHIDHIQGLAILKAYTGAPVWVDAREAEVVAGRADSHASAFGLTYEPVEPDRFYVDGASVEVGNFALEAISTPGHSPGGTSLRLSRWLFTGDALFAGSIGRTDLPGGDTQMLLDSIRTRLMIFEDDYIVFSGHGASSTIGQERRYNPFLTP